MDHETRRALRLKLVSCLKLLLASVLFLGIVTGLLNVARDAYRTRRISRVLPSNWVNLDEAQTPEAVAAAKVEQEKPVFRVAVAPIVSPEKSLEMYQPFIEYVAARLGRKPVSLYRTSYSETNDLVRYKRCDLAVVCTYPFIRGEREFGLQALAVPRIQGVTTYQSVIVVNRSSSAKSLLDLKGKRFASADIISTTGWLYPAMTLMQSGEKPNRFFGEHVITGSHDNSVRAVLDGFVEGAAVHGLVLEQMMAADPSIASKLRVLAKSPPFGIPPVVVHPATDPELKRAILSILLQMDSDPAGRIILDHLQIEKYVVPERNLFADLRKAIAELEGWR